MSFRPPFGVEERLIERLSRPDLRSTVERLSPTNLFSSSVRVSTPLRRSLPERRSVFDRFSSIAMVFAPTSKTCRQFDKQVVKPRSQIEHERTVLYCSIRQLSRIVLV
jgi:hypothetical protein